jgi:isoquinoline 1-oxidoreductase beta subunit
MGMARLKAWLDAEGWPIALEVRTCMQRDGFGPEASFDVTSRYHVPNYRYSTHTTKFHIPVGTRRGVGQAAHDFYRESFMNELAHAAGKDPYQYRRELIARTNLPYKADMLKALDMAAEMSGWGRPLPNGKARAIALEERGAEANGHGDDQRHGPHRVGEPGGEGAARARGRGARHRVRSGQPALGEEANRRADHLVLQRRDAPGDDHRRRHVVENNYNRFPISRIAEDPPEINIRFFPTGHWLIGMGHDRATSVQSAIGDAIYQITGKRFRDLPYSKHDLTWS